MKICIACGDTGWISTSTGTVKCKCITDRNASVSVGVTKTALDIRAQLDALPIIKRGRHVEWSDELDRELLSHWECGARKKSIAQVLGFSFSTCKERFEKLMRERGEKNA